MKNIHSICRKVLALTDEELDSALKESEQQAAYTHPLKLATQSKVTAAGRHNLRVLRALQTLRDVIQMGDQTK